MRNFGTAEKRAGFRADGIGYFFEKATSVDQLALVWGGMEGVVAASPHRDSSGNASLDVVRFPSDFNLGAALEMRRRNQLGLPPMSGETLFSTVVPDFSERTRILALDGERLALDDDRLAEWLVNAEQQLLHGTDNHPIFETSLEDTACSISRLPNGQVAMTDVADALGIRRDADEAPLAARQRGFRNDDVLRIAQVPAEEERDYVLFMVQQPDDQVFFYFSTVREGLKRAFVSFPSRNLVAPLEPAEAARNFHAELLYWEDKAATR